MDAVQRRAAKEKAPGIRGSASTSGRPRREIAKKGRYSWVSDIRSRVSTARSLASDEHEFMSLLTEARHRGVRQLGAAARGGTGYSIADHPTWRITGERMGLAYGKSAIQARFLVADRASPEARGRIEEIAKNA